MNVYKEYVKAIDLEMKIGTRFGIYSDEHIRAKDNLRKWESNWFHGLDYKIPYLPSKLKLLEELERQEALSSKVREK